MELGIFAKTFKRSGVREVFAAVISHKIHSVQFNFSVAGLPTLPEKIDIALSREIALETLKHQVKIAAISGTFNMIDPDVSKRKTGLKNLQELANACRLINVPVITLCTGTCDPKNMWQGHPDNNLAQTWLELTKMVGKALEMTENSGVILAMEPELNNVVNSAEKAYRLLQEMQSSRLRIVMDGANLIERDQISQMREILTHAFDLLGDKIILAHAKEIPVEEHSGYEAMGQGLLDFDFYLRLFKKYQFRGSLILHGVDETQVEPSLKFIRQRLESY